MPKFRQISKIYKEGLAVLLKNNAKHEENLTLKTSVIAQFTSPIIKTNISLNFQCTMRPKGYAGLESSIQLSSLAQSRFLSNIEYLGNVAI